MFAATFSRIENFGFKSFALSAGGQTRCFPETLFAATLAYPLAFVDQFKTLAEYD